ncbi:hypothetical protein FS749_000597 [Ceratobasidium sp. UAMH 11750]|nr:hypothetical protein FS749_000597 [Ceratobasidium sp. UAMH 11750]
MSEPAEEPSEPVAAPDSATYPLWSEAWFNKTLCEVLGYPSLRSWQLKLTMAACQGKDAVCIVATGAGKSALIQGPIVAFEAVGQDAVGIVVKPTKGLADDQARAAASKGIKALALHADANRAAAAENPPRNLFSEVANGLWPLVFIGLEMLTSKGFTRLLDLSAHFVNSLLKIVVVDECHISDEWRDFRSAYQDVKRLRDCMPSKVAWLAISATVPPSEFSAITEGLGFEQDKFELVREPVDRPDIKYVPRFIKNPMSGNQMLNFAWLVPSSLVSVNEAPITIIFVNHIHLAIRLQAYLTSLLPSNITGNARKYFIRAYHSLHSQEYRKSSLDALRAGTETRMLLCTDTGAFGINILEVEQVVIAQLSKTFKTQTQRAGRIRGKGTAFIYFAEWMATSQQTKTAIAARSRVEQVMIDFANTSLNCCPRAVACEHWGEHFEQPQNCCVIHDPDEQEHKLEVDRRVWEAKLQAKRARKNAGLGGPRATKQSYRPLDKDIMQPAIMTLLKEWRLSTWLKIPNHHPNDPPELFLSNHLLDHLCDRMHVCITFDHFHQVMSRWGYLERCGKDLYVLVELSLRSANQMHSKLEEIAEAQKAALEAATVEARLLSDSINSTGVTSMLGPSQTDASSST